MPNPLLYLWASLFVQFESELPATTKASSWSSTALVPRVIKIEFFCIRRGRRLCLRESLSSSAFVSACFSYDLRWW
ncbi:hypothetical protein B0H13DRAFT_2116906 [Mycena leptocephala]|nr:hypothetical protein B0H13DRAFT_2116906 [Mycena leptocephala]